MKKLSTAIIITGLVAGSMDITAACIQFYLKTGNGPDVIFKYISSAVVGRERAFSGDIEWNILGLAMHYCIAFGWTILFYLLYPKISLLRGNKIVVGLLYGVFVWIMMNLILVPMTKIQSGPMNHLNAVIGCAILMVCIGLPISLLAHKHFKSKD